MNGELIADSNKTPERKRLERLLKKRWLERTQLLDQAARIMDRCISWPEKQDEDFNLVLSDMGKWLKNYLDHASNMASDLDSMKSEDSN